MQLYFVHFKMVFLIFKMIKSKKKLRYTFGSYFIASPLYRFTFLQVHPHHIPCVVLLWLVSCSCSLFVRAILLPSSCPPSALLLLLLLLQRLCLAPFPFTGCVALATSSLPGRKKIKKASSRTIFQLFPLSSFNWRRLLRFLPPFQPPGLVGQTFVC